MEAEMSEKTRLTWRDIDTELYLHVNQCTVLRRPRTLKNLKHCNCCLGQNVQLNGCDGYPSKCESCSQKLVLRPLRIMVGIILKQFS